MPAHHALHRARPRSVYGVGEIAGRVIRNVEVIGEAAKSVSAEVRGRLASLVWKAICGMRDVLIHDYIGVDLDEVWNVASSRIPELQAVLEQFLAGERSEADTR